MEFRVHLGHQNGVPIPKYDIAHGKSPFRATAGWVGRGRHIVRLIDKDTNLNPPLYDPVVLRVTDTYMELGGVGPDGAPRTGILRFFLIEATAVWAREFGKTSAGPSLNGSMAHLQNIDWLCNASRMRD